MKKTIAAILGAVLCAALLIALIPSTLFAREEFEQAGYTFDSVSDIGADLGGKYPLPEDGLNADLTFGFGHSGEGASGTVALNPSLFSGKTDLTFAGWFSFSDDVVNQTRDLLLATGRSGAMLQLALSDGKLVLSYSDGAANLTCSVKMASLISSDVGGWVHIAFTFSNTSSGTVAVLYVNGLYRDGTSSSADFSKLKPSTVCLTDVSVDELYWCNAALGSDRIYRLSTTDFSTFFEEEGERTHTVSVSSVSTASSDSQSGETDDAYSYSWAAYLFEDLSPATDLHGGDLNALSVNMQGCVKATSSTITEKFGTALIRRDGAAVDAYMTLDPRLFRGQECYTFACWVYRKGTNGENGEVLLDLKGTGSSCLRFSPYSVDEDGNYAAKLEYSDGTGTVRSVRLGDGKLTQPSNHWVHYALTLSANGTATVYVNAKKVATVSTGLNPKTMTLSDASVLTGSAAGDSIRTAIDEIYVSPKILDEAEFRKMRYYGLARYTSEVLPDPGADSEGTGEEDGPTVSDIDLTEDAFSKTGTISGGFIGTTFDDRNAPDADVNGAVRPTLTGGQLAGGVASYGLSLNGSNQFLRYPIGILDGARELTISLSYKWSGASANDERSQRLFDFSRKSSSVSDPTAFVFLEMGTGASGLRLGLSDGISSTYLNYDYNQTETWTRVTVTVADGKVSLWLDDRMVASGYTDVTVSLIQPNYCYIGRSGVHGDPSFKGTVDEIYISDTALSADRIPTYLNGISAAGSGSDGKIDSGTRVMWIVIAVASVLAACVIGVIVFLIVGEVKRKRAEKPTELPIAPLVPETEPSDRSGDESVNSSNPVDGVGNLSETVRFSSLSDVGSLSSTEETVKIPSPQTDSEAPIGRRARRNAQKRSAEPRENALDPIDDDLFN